MSSERDELGAGHTDPVPTSLPSLCARSITRPVADSNPRAQLTSRVVTSIEVEGLGKRYVLGVPKAAQAWWPFRRAERRAAAAKHPRFQEIWALRDVSFSLTPGTVL